MAQTAAGGGGGGGLCGSLEVCAGSQARALPRVRLGLTAAGTGDQPRLLCDPPLGWREGRKGDVMTRRDEGRDDET